MENKEKFKKELFPEESSLEELYSDGPELAAELTNVFHITHPPHCEQFQA